MEKEAFDRQAELEAMSEEYILETLNKLVDLAVRTYLTDTIAYVACCRELVKHRLKRRKADRH